MKNLKFRNGFHVTIEDLISMSVPHSIADGDSEYYAYDVPVCFSESFGNPVDYFAAIDYEPQKPHLACWIVNRGSVKARMYYTEPDGYCFDLVVALTESEEYMETLTFSNIDEAHSFVVHKIFTQEYEKDINSKTFMLDNRMNYRQKSVCCHKDLPENGEPVIVLTTYEQIMAASFLYGTVEVYSLRRNKPSVRMLLSPESFNKWFQEVAKLRGVK